MLTSIDSVGRASASGSFMVGDNVFAENLSSLTPGQELSLFSVTKEQTSGFNSMKRIKFSMLQFPLTGLKGI